MPHEELLERRAGRPPPELELESRKKEIEAGFHAFKLLTSVRGPVLGQPSTSSWRRA